MEMNYKLLNKKSINDVSLITLGCFISSIGINMFLSHAKLLSGGATGIALIIQYIFGIRAGITVLIINVPLFVLSYFKLDKKFTIYSLVGTLALSLFLIFTYPLTNILKINDELLLCIYGGVLNGLGFGIIFSRSGSTGGTDIITMLLKKKYGYVDVGKISFCLNLIIVLFGASVFGLANGLYTLIAIYINTTLLDAVIKGFKKNKMVFVITDNENEVEEAIMSNLNRGVTFLYGEGAYTKSNRRVLYTIVHLNQLPELKNIVNEIDPHAFMTIVDASEVEGKGFINR